MAVLTVVAGLGVLFDDRMLRGEAIWLKPLKFSVSLTLYSVTLAWMLSVFGTRRRWVRVGVAVIVAALSLEMALLVTQVVRGRMSHFNVSTPLDAAIYATLGLTVGVFWLANAVIAVVLWRTRIADAATSLAVRLALLISLAGMGIGYLMTNLPSGVSGIVGAHSVGVPDGGPGIPVTGWSTLGGDLRVAHFVGIHAMQVLPLVALLLRRWVAGPVQVRLVAVAAVAYSGLIGLLTWQAMRGQPVLQPDAATLAALGILIGGSMVAGVLAFRSRPAHTHFPAAADEAR